MKTTKPPPAEVAPQNSAKVLLEVLHRGLQLILDHTGARGAGRRASMRPSEKLAQRVRP